MTKQRPYFLTTSQEDIFNLIAFPILWKNQMQNFNFFTVVALWQMEQKLLQLLFWSNIFRTDLACKTYKKQDEKRKILFHVAQLQTHGKNLTVGKNTQIKFLNLFKYLIFSDFLFWFRQFSKRALTCYLLHLFFALHKVSRYGSLKGGEEGKSGAVLCPNLVQWCNL